MAWDLRCLDAHAHLGNLTFDRSPTRALRHYAMGARIAELSLPPGLRGVLAWGWLGNRPFLRCLHGWALCLWRTGRFTEAQAVIERMLWLNPTDNQGVLFLHAQVAAGRSWEESVEG